MMMMSSMYVNLISIKYELNVKFVGSKLYWKLVIFHPCSENDPLKHWLSQKFQHGSHQSLSPDGKVGFCVMHIQVEFVLYCPSLCIYVALALWHVDIGCIVFAQKR